MTNDSIINKFVNNLPFELHLFDPVVGRYSACGPGTKHQDRIEKYIQTGDTSHIYKNELDKHCFYHDSAYDKHKDVSNRQVADKKLMDGAFAIASDQSKNGYERMLASMIYKFFDKKIQMGQGAKEDILADELHKPIKHNFKRRRVNVFKPNDILACDLVDMVNNRDEGYRYILTAQDVFTKYSFAIPLKTKKTEELMNAFKTIFKTHKFAKIWTDQETGIYSTQFQEFLLNQNVGLYSTASEKKVSVIERFNRTLKEWMYKEFTKTNSTKWLKLLPKLVDKYNHRVHSTTKVKPVDAYKSKHKDDINQSINTTSQVKRKPKLKQGDHVRIYKWKTEWEKGFTPKWTKEIFTIDSVNTRSNPPVYYLRDSNNDLIEVPYQPNKPAGFYQEELQKSKL